MAFAPSPVKAPARVPLARGRLLDIIGELDTPDQRWLHGVTWQPEPCARLLTMAVDVCSRIDFIGAPRVCDPAITQTAFSVYDALMASLLEYEPEEIVTLIEARVTLKTSAAFARELLTGAVSGNQALRKSALVSGAGATATPIYTAFVHLEAALADRMQGAAGLIHLPPGLLSEAVRMCGLHINSAGQWETPLGNTVIADAGYYGAPQPTGYGAAAAAGQDWVYASGPVEYKMTEMHRVDDDNIGSTITNYLGTEDLRSADYRGFRTRNVSTRFVDREGILVFDPCPVTAALVTYSENS